MPGPLKTLFGALKASSFMSGVTVVFGKEEVGTQKFPQPWIAMVPTTAQYANPGYARGIDTDTNTITGKSQYIEFWLYTSSTDPAAQGAIDHVDAIESLEALMIGALQDQREQYVDTNSISLGLSYHVVGSRWEDNTNPVSKYGRTIVVTAQLDITIVTPIPPQATVETTEFDPSVVNAPS